MERVKKEDFLKLVDSCKGLFQHKTSLGGELGYLGSLGGVDYYEEEVRYGSS